MQAIIPRYEFRAFAQNFGIKKKKIRKFSRLEKFRESSEIYILSHGNNENNVKIRYDVLDIKVFVKEEKGLQQWNPRLKADFPMKIEVIRDDVLPALGAAVPEFNRSAYTLEQFLEDILIPHSELVLARVFKRRYGYMISGCISEIAELLINGAAIKTIALESADIEVVVEVKQKLGLNEYENVSYLLAIKRILGMAPGTRLGRDLVTYVKTGRKLSFFFSSRDPGHRVLLESSDGVASRLVRKGEIPIAIMEDADHTMIAKRCREDFMTKFTERMTSTYPTG